MKHKRAVLLTESDATRKALIEQLREYLDDVDIIGHPIDQGDASLLDADLYIVSSALQYNELLRMGYDFSRKKVIIGKRTVNTEHLDQVVEIEAGTEVLLINDSEESAYDSIRILNYLGVNHINYVAYYPGIELDITKYSIAVTVGEIELIPNSVTQIIDIGTRIFDFSTIAKILIDFDMIDEKGGMFSIKYLQKIIRIAQNLSASKSRISELTENLKTVVDGLEEGLLAYDRNGKITVFNENLKKMLKPRSANSVGMKLNHVIFNQKILAYLMDMKNFDNKIITLEGEEVIIHKTKAMWKDVTIATFNASRPEAFAIGNNHHKIINKGFVGKYKMDDIVGESPAIKKVKEIAEKLAKTDMTILVEGESGTGKEMFASAIHNISNRSNAPFLGINFSALPDDLVESELFGYAEGAFTGAKKGGKEGFFEQANDGTIFLDEIGDISLKVQARLLRVLEEKEIMRIGGNKIQPVNVRVIAATNKDLSKLVEENKFREDLYFRLKMGFLQLPPLRQRREDISLILNQLIATSTIEDIRTSSEVSETLKNYDWLGNVRELKNTVIYMLAIKSGDVLTIDDLPQKSFFKTSKSAKTNDVISVYEPDRFELFILKTLYEQPGIGRKALSDLSYKNLVGMTENQIRGKLKRMDDEGLLERRKGRLGNVLTKTGRSLVEL